MVPDETYIARAGAVVERMREGDARETDMPLRNCRFATLGLSL